MSVSRWTVAELDAARHPHELPGPGGGRRVRGAPPPRERPVQVHVDTAHSGCGGMGEGGAKLWATAQQSMVGPRQGPWRYSLRLRPLTGATWAHGGVRSSP
ncbi:unnamed protein product [Prorocentrum cordatum]|uniref:Beta-galactosidase n=1 Tax=Prorocentrum cordatum TaxID=2364126 RepID=A0ABN9W8M4_9DINO|nr:unnamed protein product [Polarella glacialis]